MRVLAARLPPEAAARARQRKYQQAQKHGRTPSAATLALADWVLVATTLAADWSLTRRAAAVSGAVASGTGV